MRQVTICRSDFGGNKDSEGRSYFDYILSSLAIPQESQFTIDEIDLNVEGFTAWDNGGGIETREKVTEL